jgi:small-conductance mechanosensitive channel
VNEVAIPVVAIMAWAAIVLLKIYQGMRRRELVHRERLAMIERGLVPPPETDPQRFERAMGLHPGHLDRPPGHGIRPGLILIAVGIGVGVLISLTSGNFGAGIGVGTLLVLLGIALLIGAVWESSVVREFVERAVTGEDRHGPRPESSSPTEPRPPR